MALTKATLVDLNSNELILDLDADTSITADTDDTIHFKIAGSDEITMTAAGLSPASADGNALGTAALEWSDLFLADGAVINLGADQDVTLTHVHNTGLLLNSTMQLQFNDSSQFINAPSNAILDINATDEIELNATLVDVNANLDVSGTITIGNAEIAEAELEQIDGITAGTVIASKALVADANIDITGGRNITITGELSAATLDIGGTNITSTAAEINLIDGGTSRGTDALATGDGILINDAGTMKMTNVDTVQTFMQSGIVGKQTIWIPAAAITPTASNGCATRTQVETTAGRPDMDVLDFDASSDEHAQFSVAFPKSWNLGTVTFQAFWTSTATDTDGVAWGLQGVACSSDDTIDVAYGTAIVVTDDNISAAEDLLVTAESSAITIAGTPADDDLTYFRIYRDVSAGNDDMAGDARLHGVKIFFTTDALNDD